MSVRRLDEGIEELLKARELDPLGPVLSTTWEIGVYIQNRLFNETLAELEKAKVERKDDSVLIYDTGMIYAAQGRQAEALQTIKKLEEMSSAGLSQAHWIAKIYATLNQKETALTWLERGLATGAIGAFLKDDPVWDPIRSDPLFAELLRRMSIPS
jgi:tetratricopeptide (TPR) repeat protein